VTNNKSFVVGTDYHSRNSQIEHVFNPNMLNNFHLSISGSSGSGKTRMGKKIVEYLGEIGKHVHIVDIKGDFDIPDENYIEFPIRNAQYGINPFEFDRDVKTGGVKKRASEIVDIVVKVFELKIGAAKKDVISRLIYDTYVQKGITENETTWGLNLSKAEQASVLPSIDDLCRLTNTIIDAVNYGQTNRLDSSMKKSGKKAIKSASKIQKIQSIINQIRTKSNDANYSKASDLHNNNNPEDKTIEELLETLFTESEDYTKVINLRQDIEREQVEIEASKTVFIETASFLFDSFIDNNGDSKSSAFESFVTEDETLNLIDLKYYSKKTVTDMLESVLVYFEMLSNSGLFNKNIPPVKPGINRYDISKHKQKNQIFFTEIIASRLFYATKMRGDYVASVSQSYKNIRGEKNDTFLIVDEAQVALPDSNSREKESSTQIFNRIAAESRSHGLGLILISQSLTRFSNVVNINIPNKIIFRTLGSDINATKKIVGITKGSDNSFDIINGTFGIGLYIDESQRKSIFLSPWYSNTSNKRKI